VGIRGMSSGEERVGDVITYVFRDEFLRAWMVEGTYIYYSFFEY
jgi:hypothetical protein